VHLSSLASLYRSRGKLVSIGACAPLSFFQTVRRLVATTVDAYTFAPETGDCVALEKVYLRTVASGGYGANSLTIKAPIGQAVPAYLDVTAGLIDLVDSSRLVGNIADKAPEVTATKHKSSRDAKYLLLLNYLSSISAVVVPRS